MSRHRLECQVRRYVGAPPRNLSARSRRAQQACAAGVRRLEQETPAWQSREYVRLDYVASRAYVGSVIVNERNSRCFEGAPELGLRYVERQMARPLRSVKATVLCITYVHGVSRTALIH